MDPGDASVLSESTRLPDAGGSGSTNNLKTPTDMLQLRNDPLGGGFNRYNEGGTVAGSGNEDSVPSLLRPREVVIPASEGNIAKTPYIAPKMRGGQGGNIRPPSTIKISNSVVLPAIRKEEQKKEVREGSTIPTFQISSIANSRQYTLMGMGLEGMV